MTQHLWLWAGGGSAAKPCCRSAPKWNYAKTTEKLGTVGLWQGKGDKCRLCLYRVGQFVKALGKQVKE